MHDQHMSGEKKPHSREYLDHVHLQAKLWSAESRAAEEYERALQEFQISIPHEPTVVPSLVERLRPVAVAIFFVCIAFFLCSWGVV